MNSLLLCFSLSIYGGFALRLLPTHRDLPTPESIDLLNVEKDWSESVPLGENPDQYVWSRVLNQQLLISQLSPSHDKQKESDSCEKKSFREGACSAGDFLAYTRIPKTGGTMLRDYINKHADHELLPYIFHDPASSLAMKTSLLNGRHKLYTKHSMFGIHKIGCHPGCYFTVLRHPVDRAISKFFHDGDHAGASLSALESELLNPKITNPDKEWQRQMNGSSQILSHFCTFNLQTCMLCGADAECDGPTAFEKARANLKEYYAVGVLEHLSETLTYFTQMYPMWFGKAFTNLPASIRHHSKFKSKDLSPDVTNKYESEAWADLALWEEAVANIQNSTSKPLP